mgnify:CR=1 FL=1
MAWTQTYGSLVHAIQGAVDAAAVGLSIVGRQPGQTVRIVGATSLASITGYNTGTANTGTTTTTVAKPAGGTNWTSSALIGLWLKPISGGGAPAAGAAPVAGSGHYVRQGHA